MKPDGDPRVSDEATGLPPLEDIENDITLVVLAWAGSEGIAAYTADGVAVDGGTAVRYLHLRGLIEGGESGVEWAQIHIAVPVEHAVDVAACLASGGSS